MRRRLRVRRAHPDGQGPGNYSGLLPHCTASTELHGKIDRRVQVALGICLRHGYVAVSQDDLRRVQAGLLADPGCSRVPLLVWRPWLDSGLLARRSDRCAIAGNGDMPAALAAKHEPVRILGQPGSEQEPGPWADRDDAILSLVHGLVQPRAVDPHGL